MRQSGGDSHGTIKDVPWEQYEKLKTHPFVKESAPCILVADVIRNPDIFKASGKGTESGADGHASDADQAESGKGDRTDLYHYWGRSEEDIGEENLTESFIEACEAQDGFADGGRIYGTGTVGLDAASWIMPKELKKNEKGEYCPWYANEPLKPDENGILWDTMLYGLERFTLGEAEVYEGEADVEKLWEKLSTGKYLLYAVPVDDNDKVQTEWSKHHVGDKIILVMEDGTRREFEILALIKENFFGLTYRASSEFSYYTTADVFGEMASDQFLMSYAFDVEDDKEEEISRFVEQYTTTQEPLMDYESRQLWVDDFSGMKNLFVLV